MRILLLSNLFPPYVEGGAEILAGDIANGLQALGHEVLVLTSSTGLPEAKSEGNIWRTLRIFPVAHFDTRRPGFQQLNQLYNYRRRYHCAANARELQRVIAEVQPDILYIWEVTGIGVTSLMQALQHVQQPIVFHLGSYWLLYTRKPETEQSRLSTRRLKQWLIGAVPVPEKATMIAVSKTVKQQYVAAGFDAERIEVIYNGIDPRFLASPRTSREATREGPLQLLYVGRLRVEKGVAVILKALDLLRHEQSLLRDGQLPIHLHIFGSGDQLYIDELRQFLQEKGLSSAVTFHGRVPQEELIGYYDRSDIMLVPSLWQEPFGLVIAEAMARELPVIASDLAGPSEILSHRQDGLLLPPGDEQALAEAIHSLMEHPEERLRLGRAARETVRQRFTIALTAQRVEQHLRQSLQYIAPGNTYSQETLSL